MCLGFIPFILNSISQHLPCCLLSVCHNSSTTCPMASYNSTVVPGHSTIWHGFVLVRWLHIWKWITEVPKTDWLSQAHTVSVRCVPALKATLSTKPPLIYTVASFSSFSLYLISSFSILPSKPWKGISTIWEMSFPSFKSLQCLSRCQKHLHNCELVLGQ